jgi:hypothetical protein
MIYFNSHRVIMAVAKVRASAKQQTLAEGKQMVKAREFR